MPSCVITGASSGIGLILAEGLRKQGYQVVGIQRTPGFGVTADLRNPNEIGLAWREAQRMCRDFPELLVLNAGYCIEGPLSTLSLDDLTKIVETNLVAPLLLTKAALHTLPKSDQSIHFVFIGSQAGLPGRTTKNSIAYSASKAALHAIALGIATEYAPFVRSNVIAPGWVKTPAELRLLRENHPDPSKAEQQIVEASLIKRSISPSEILDAVLFLHNCKAMTGTIINVSGGSSIY